MNARFISNPRAWLALLVLPGWATVASAQIVPSPKPAPQPAAQAADPNAPVPATPYRSVFSDLPTGVEQTRHDWKQANDEVGRFARGHVDILKWEQQQVGQQKAAAPANTAPAAQPMAMPDATKPVAAPAHKQ